MAPTTMTDAGLPELLSASELADYLGVPVSTIHYWRGKGQGPPALKVGKRLRFRTADVADWLAGKEARSQDNPTS